jgi:hypothetical protein
VKSSIMTEQSEPLLADAGKTGGRRKADEHATRGQIYEAKTVPNIENHLAVQTMNTPT